MKYVFPDKTTIMKKIILLFLLCASTLLNAQSSYRDLPGKWRLGFNMGGIWESSDVKPIPGLGGGFVLEKILNKRADAFLGFSLGFRYLGGRTYGINGTPTYDIANNEALNGTFNKAIRYDSVPGFFYANHKTFIQEGALELKMNFPNLERKTGIIFHLWGGIGIGKYKTWIDALDKDGKMYDFSNIKNQNATQSDLSHIFDNKYETLAQGSGTNGTLCFIPSLGVGLGYRLGKGVALVFEEKVSFPGTNLLDGIEYPKNCPITGSKDFYNYTSVGIVFTFYGNHSSSGSSTSTGNTTGTQTTTTTKHATYIPPPPVVYPPTVVITYPGNNFQSPYDYTTVNASLTNVSSAQQINISQNGYAINHFTYNANNGTLHFQTFLSQGANNFVITASNQGGTASQALTIHYNPIVFNSGGFTTGTTTTTTTTGTVVTTGTVTPSHTVTTTTTTGTVVTTGTVTPTHTVTTTTTGTVSPSHTVTPTLTVTTTGTVSPTHTVNPTLTVTPTGSVTPTGTVSIGTATVSPTGTVTSTLSGTISPVHGVPVKPVVTFIDPASYSSETTSDSYNVTGTVLNVSNSSQVSITVNGTNLSAFTYNNSNRQVNFTTNLQLGYNTITITGTNSAGSDTKSEIINHKPAGKPPKVVISNPSTSPFTSLQNNVIVSGYVYNVLSSANVNVTANGAPTTFNYNIYTHEISVAAYLVAKNTTVKISATNEVGSDAQSIELIYKEQIVINPKGDSSRSVLNIPTVTTETRTQEHGGGIHGSHNFPEINVLSPSVDPFYTNTGNISISATIDYIVNPADVTVTYNGIQVSVTFDMGSKYLNFSSPLKPGLNTFMINAANQNGSKSKPININYTPIIVNTAPAGNSGGGNNNNSGPTFNHGGWHIGGGNNTSPSPNTSPNSFPPNNGGQTSPVKPNFNTSPAPPVKPANNDAAPPSSPQIKFGSRPR
jgi:hypothetical protein